MAASCTSICSALIICVCNISCATISCVPPSTIATVAAGVSVAIVTITPIAVTATALLIHWCIYMSSFRGSIGSIRCGTKKETVIEDKKDGTNDEKIDYILMKEERNEHDAPHYEQQAADD